MNIRVFFKIQNLDFKKFCLALKTPQLKFQPIWIIHINPCLIIVEVTNETAASLKPEQGIYRRDMWWTTILWKRRLILIEIRDITCLWKKFKNYLENFFFRKKKFGTWVKILSQALKNRDNSAFWLTRGRRFRTHQIWRRGLGFRITLANFFPMLCSSKISLERDSERLKYEVYVKKVEESNRKFFL